MSSSMPNNFANYQIIEEIARGGMGIVYRAVQKNANRIVALKILMPSAAKDNKQIRRFLREAQAASRLQHPNIIPIYHMDKEGNCYYFTMKYIEGGKTFRDIIERSDVPVQEKVTILMKVCYALHHAHEKRILHRDIKPSNILIDKRGEPFVADFGLVKFVDSKSHLTQTGSTIGTPSYMSPEQVDQQFKKAKMDRRSDIYSLGVILYQILTQRLPFTGNNLVELYYKITREEPVHPLACNSKLSPALASICMCAMNKTPQFRYATALQMARDLEQFFQGGKIRAQKINPLAMLHRCYRIHYRKLLALFVAIVILFSITIAWYWSQSAPPKNELRKLKLKKYWQQARQQFNAAKYGQALQSLEQILQFAPEYRRAIHFKAQILQKQQKFAEMRLLWARIYELTEDAQELLILGKEALHCGYLQDAEKYLRKANEYDADSIEIQRYMGQTLLCAGKYRQAKTCYRRLQETLRLPEVLLGLAQIAYYEKQYDRARRHLQQLEEVSNTTAYLQAHMLLLNIRIQWEMQHATLCSWEWLSCKHNDDSRVIAVHNLLRRLENELKLVCKKIDAAATSSYRFQILREQVQLCLNGLVLERQEPERSPATLREVTAHVSRQLPRFQIFFREVVIRFLLRSKQWQRAIRACSEAHDKFPWVESFYYMRAIAKFHVQEISASISDTLKAIDLDKYNFVPIGNITSLLFAQSTHEELAEFFRMLMRFTLNPFPRVKDIVFHRFLTKLHEKYFQDEVAEQKHRDVPWRALMETVITSSSPAARQLALQIFAQHEEEHWRALLKDYPRDMRSKFLEDLQNIVAKRKRRQKKRLLREKLLKYSVLRERKYPLSIRKQPDLLSDILLDAQEKPLMRLLAARMMIAVKTYPMLQQLRSLSQTAPYPVNLLATIALRENSIAIAIPRMTFRKIKQYNQRLATDDRRFYRMLLALTINPNHFPKLAHSLLYAPQEIVALCAAFNFRKCHWGYEVFSGKQIEKRLVKFMYSKDSQVRALANQVFWDFQPLLSPQVNKNQQLQHQKLMEMCDQYWKEYRLLMVSALRDPAIEVKFAAIRNMSRLELTRYFQNYVNAKDPLFQKLLSTMKTLLNKNTLYSLRFWSTAMFSIIDKRGEAWKIIKDPGAPFFIRTAVIYGVLLRFMCDQKDVINLYFYLCRCLEKTPRSVEDRKFRQLAFVLLGRWKIPSPMIPDLTPQLLRCAQKPEASLRRAALATILWHGNRSTIRKLQPYLRSPDIHTQRAAAASMANLLSYYRLEQMSQFHNYLQKMPQSVRTAAALGHYHQIEHNILFLPGVIPFPRWRKKFSDQEGEYSSYLEYLAREGNKDSLDRLLDALKAMPNARYFYEAALLSFQFSQYAQASRLVNQALKYCTAESAGKQAIPTVTHYQHARCLILKAQIFMQKRYYKQARLCLQQALQEDVINAEAYFHLANVWQDLGKKERAQHCYVMSYICNPKSAIPLVNAAINYINQSNIPKAIELLKLSPARFQRQSYFKNHRIFSVLKNHPWVKSLKH